MILTIDNADDYLLKKALLNAESVIDGDVKIFDNSRKNRNIRVIRKNNTSYLLKQPSIGDVYSATTIQREATLYKLIKMEKDLYSIKEIVPNIIEFDLKEIVLILEYINNSESYREYNYNLMSAGNLHLEVTSTLGRMIAIYHRDFERLLFKSKNGYPQSLSFLPRSLPFNIAVIRPNPFLLSIASPANIRLLKIIQQYPEILDFFENVYRDWYMQQTLVHGDIKWDNIIVVRNNQQKVIDIRIVDWELATVGDPAWDIGGILHDFIDFWINSLPITQSEDIEILVKSAQDYQDNLKKAIRSFWGGYITEIEMEENKLQSLLIRSARYCALRLIQKVFEAYQYSYDLSNQAIYSIQTSLNIVLNVYDAILHLFGIPI